MASANQILEELKALGTEQTKKTLMRHGAREPIYGVKVEDLKKIQKRCKGDHPLALALYDSGVSDAMYLAGLLADDAKMSREDLDRWVKTAYWHMLSECTVPWVAAGSPHGWEAALDWIDSREETVAAAGWATLSSIASVRPDTALAIKTYEALLLRVGREIHQEKNRVRSAMNNFLISVGCYITSLNAAAKTIAERIGPVNVEMGKTACNVPYAPDYIRKVEQRGSLGKKRATAKC